MGNKEIRRAVKYCPKCHATKSLDEFGINRSKADGRQGYCIPCMRSASKEAKQRVHDTDCDCKGCVARFNAAHPDQKWCPKCKTGKSLSEFHGGSGVQGCATYCIPCSPVADIRQRRRAHWKHRYNITEQEVFALLTAQNRSCACGDPIDEESLTVDHDHACCPGADSCGNCVRGLLCGLCNRALGCLRDDPNRALALATYLLRFEDVLQIASTKGETRCLSA